MPRALSRDEQTVLNYVRKHAGVLPLPTLAEALALPPETVQAACAYLVSRGLLHAELYAVSAAGKQKLPTVTPAGLVAR